VDKREARGRTDLRRLLRECDVPIGSRLRVRKLAVAQRSLDLQEAEHVEHVTLLRCHAAHSAPNGLQPYLPLAASTPAPCVQAYVQTGYMYMYMYVRGAVPRFIREFQAGAGSWQAF
jgi:hypothetical protein